jgi:hypothetical protein
MSGAETVVVTRKHEGVACDCIAEWQSSKSGFAPHGSFTEAGKVIAHFEAEVTRATQADALAVMREAEAVLAPFARAEHIVASVEMGRIRCVLTYPEGARATFCLADLKRAQATLANLRAAIARARSA